MKKNTIYSILLLSLISFSAIGQNTMTVHTDLAKTKINKEIYGHFAESLMKSQRPGSLNEEELEQYDILLEEQAYPFEEKAIEIHSANAKRTSEGLYDEWVKKSIAALSVLQPIRYAKNERIDQCCE